VYSTPWLSLAGLAGQVIAIFKLVARTDTDKKSMQKSNIESTTVEIDQTRSIEQIRKTGIDKQTLERIAAERAEMERARQEAKGRLPGHFVSLKQDKEQRTFLFTGEYQKVQVPAKDFVTKQTIPGKMVTKFRFQVYDVTSPDTLSPEPSIWERGFTEADQILYWLSQGKAELTIMRNGAPNSQKTTYSIFPAGR
jgi:hypothetical protein